ncbi:MAG TPA: SDR family NAD(P)-dependent oxidoreductase [Thermoanaerobaculia bacterium]|nr:SDR family NAD(P)-dependent oxidoreductase [Thermoanaerobaculia bacterium]
MDTLPFLGVAVITGASRGLGAVFARVFSEEGFAVALGARDTAAVEQLAAELPGPVFAHRLDVADPGSVEAFRRAVLERFGRVDVVVNNAGIGVFKRLERTSPEEMEQTFRVNVFGAWAVTVAFLPQLKDSRGLVLMVSSDVSTRTFPTGGSYTASKFALRALTRTLQQENPDLRVLELRPGAVDTYFAGSTPGAPGKDWFLQPQVVGEAVRFALRLPPGARVEEIVLRSTGQTPEY